jgi:transposase
MFVRVTKTPNSPRKSVKVVASIREGSKVRQKMIYHVGIAYDEKEVKKLMRIGYEYIAKEELKSKCDPNQKNIFNSSINDLADGIEKTSKKSQENRLGRRPRISLSEIIPVSEVTIDQIVEECRIIEGINEVFGKVYDDMGYNDVLKKIKDKNLLKDLVLTRIVSPASKNKTQKILSRRFNKDYDLDSIYRILDKLHIEIGKIKKITFNGTMKLTPENVEIIFFDVTTLYFESENEDKLRAFGYSKDHRFNTTQVVLALATNSDGLPIGYELFKGNKAEVGTLCESIESWRKEFNIGSVCFVGDRAMMSSKNIELLEKMSYGYVIAAKLRSMPKSIQNELLNEKNYIPVEFGDLPGLVGEFSYNEKRLIVSYKEARAKNDSRKRDKIVDKLKNRLGSKGDTKKLITNNGVRKYTTTTETAETIIDNDKINRDSEWDGLHGVITNLKEMNALSVLQRYSGLWIIEESFRINKHSLSMRPIYHFKEKRIAAHIALCYMAFTTLRHLQYRVAISTKISPECIIDELSNVQSSIYIHKLTGHKYRIPGAFSHVATKIYKAMGISRCLDVVPFIF